MATWQAEAGIDGDPAAAEAAGLQAASFLLAAVHAEVDGAQVDPIRVLMDPLDPGRAIFAVAAVAGPLRNYLVTARGRAGRVASKQIVSHGSLEECRAAAEALIAGRLSGAGATRRYVAIGTYIP